METRTKARSALNARRAARRVSEANNPDCLSPANNRKTPFTEEGFDTFVDGSILDPDNQD